MVDTNKELRLMAEYSATGLWGKEGYPLDLGDYDISTELRLKILDWAAWYEYNESWKCDEDYTYPFNTEAFVRTGYTIAQLLKQELPEYNIRYFDEIKAEYIQI